MAGMLFCCIQYSTAVIFNPNVKMPREGRDAPCGLGSIVHTISPSRFLAECHKRRLNQGSFVLLYFVLFPF